MHPQSTKTSDLSRRDLLCAGGVAGLGMTLPGLLAARANAAQSTEASAKTFGAAKQVIMLYLHGGHPQQETFDPKPDGPSAVRGEFGAISTSVSGVAFSELLPETATLMDRMAVVRSMSHGNANHVQASLPANTGHVHPEGLAKRGDFPPSNTDFPPFGAVLDSLGVNTTELPTWIRIGPLMRRSNGTVLHGQLPGFLGATRSPFVIDQPLLKDDVEIEALRAIDGLTSPRLRARRDLLQQVDAQREVLERSAHARDLDAFYQRAFSLLAGSKTREAFDLAAESPATRERYGNTEFGQRCLLARRLAEAGVPMVNVSYCHTPSGSWDTHGQHFKRMKDSLAPTFDAAFSALLCDLEERGRLSDTLVVVNAEFGRTPKINGNSGRDHWPWVYSLALAGAGVKAGTVYGASDDSAAYPTENPHDPKDFAATLYHLLGIPADTLLHDLQNRPHSLVIGQPIESLLG